MKAIVTVVGKDRVGIIAQVCTTLAAYQVNVLDISQTVMQGYFGGGGIRMYHSSGTAVRRHGGSRKGNGSVH